MLDETIIAVSLEKLRMVGLLFKFTFVKLFLLINLITVESRKCNSTDLAGYLKQNHH